jgi:hypothetical protein
MVGCSPGATPDRTAQSGGNQSTAWQQTTANNSKQQQTAAGESLNITFFGGPASSQAKHTLADG